MQQVNLDLRTGFITQLATTQKDEQVQFVY